MADVESACIIALHCYTTTILAAASRVPEHCLLKGIIIAVNEYFRERSYASA
jgi:hypothetical protein